MGLLLVDEGSVSVGSWRRLSVGPRAGAGQCAHLTLVVLSETNTNAQQYGALNVESGTAERRVDSLRHSIFLVRYSAVREKHL